MSAPAPRPLGKIALAERALKRAHKAGRLDDRTFARELSRLQSPAERETAAAEIIAWLDRLAAPPKPASDRPAPKPRPAPDPSKLSPAKLAALAKARAARVKPVLIVPAGYRSIDHFLDSVAERCGRRFGGAADLARYLAVGSKTVSRWLSRAKTPAQPNIDAIALWMQSK